MPKICTSTQIIIQIFIILYISYVSFEKYKKISNSLNKTTTKHSLYTIFINTERILRQQLYIYIYVKISTRYSVKNCTKVSDNKVFFQAIFILIYPSLVSNYPTYYIITNKIHRIIMRFALAYLLGEPFTQTKNI